MQNPRWLPIVALLVCSLFCACSHTALTSSRRDPQYTGGMPKKVLIVGITHKDLMRWMLEDEFVSQLESEGIQAASSYRLFTVEQLMEQREQIENKVKALGFDQVIVTRLVDKQTQETIQPGVVGAPGHGVGYYGWNDYYRDSVTAVYQLPVSSQETVAIIESKLFDLGTGKVIWSGLIEADIVGTALSEREEGFIRKFVRLVMKDLKKEKLI